MLFSKILTQEDWNTVLYNGMAATSPLAALYFVALMTFGNYVLFNLLVAILVEGFQAEVSHDHKGEKKHKILFWGFYLFELYFVFSGSLTGAPHKLGGNINASKFTK